MGERDPQYGRNNRKPSGRNRNNWRIHKANRIARIARRLARRAAKRASLDQDVLKTSTPNSVGATLATGSLSGCGSSHSTPAGGVTPVNLDPTSTTKQSALFESEDTGDS